MIVVLYFKKNNKYKTIIIINFSTQRVNACSDTHEDDNVIKHNTFK